MMDQMACAAGGLVSIDFMDTENPSVKKQMYDFSKDGITLCITDTKGSHADLTADYDAVPAEMKLIAGYFNKDYLRSVSKDDFYAAVPKLRKIYSDRAVMRASHFFDENRRVSAETSALEQGNITSFLDIVNQSGNSSALLLQNLYSPNNPLRQEIPLAIMISKRVLSGNGAVRVHGGGFAGTIQAFVPNDKLDEYIEAMESLFGFGSCHKVKIRPLGGIKII